MAELFVVNGTCGGTVYALPDVPTVLGRSPECHLQISDGWVSSMHALFERRGEELWVVDLDSRNGTFVNEERVHESPVEPGARLRFGRTLAELRAESQASEPSGVLSGQRTVVRYIADLSSDTSGRRAPAAGERQERAGRDTLRGPDEAMGTARRHIGVLNELARALASASSPEESLRQILVVLSAALAAHRSSALLIGEDGEPAPVLSEPADAPARPDATVVQATLRSRAGILVLDPHGADLPARGAGAGIRSSICAPIWADNRILGVLVLERLRGEPFTAEDLDVATLVGFHAALAVERARRGAAPSPAGELRARLLRHLPPDAAGPLLEGEDGQRALEPVVREDATVLAAALEGVDALATARPPAEVGERVVAVQAALAAIAWAENGTVEARLDGGLLAVLGAPVSRPDGGARALRCARSMLERAAELEATREPPRLRLRIGLEIGRVLQGDFGPPGRPELRALGDAVEGALRLVAEAAPGEALAGPGVARRSRRSDDEPLEPRANGRGALRVV